MAWREYSIAQKFLRAGSEMISLMDGADKLNSMNTFTSVNSKMTSLMDMENSQKLMMKFMKEILKMEDIMGKAR